MPCQGISLEKPKNALLAKTSPKTINEQLCARFIAGLGGSATYKRTPFYYMVTPPLGEIDFVKKPSGDCAGCYKVDIFDLAIAGAAYGSQGTSIPSLNWFPGADIAPPSGSIDHFDYMSGISLNWDKEFDPIEP